MNRREILGGMAAMTAAVSTNMALAQPWKNTKPAAAPPGGHHHHSSAKAELLMDAVANCINKGEICLSHCIMLMGDGDKSVAGCARTVSETLALCEGLRKLAAQGSPRAKEVAKIAMASCLDCEKECRKHEQKHAECRDCAKACADCAKECKSFLG
jgi:Cys-rich four helix bundle protein (predicted Tat secretion target)